MNTHWHKADVRRSFAAAALRYDAAASLQRQVATRLLQLFPLQAQAGAVMDLGCGTGFLSGLLSTQLQAQHLYAVDIAQAMLQACRLKQYPITGYVCADAEYLPFAADSFQQIYASLALQWCQNLTAVFSDCRRVLQTGGHLSFATFGPDTLCELKQAWRQVDDYPHVNEFYSLEHISACLRQAGFAGLQTDIQLYQPTYPSVLALMRELKQIGAHNMHVGRKRRMTSRSQLQTLFDAYQQQMVETDIYASYQVIFVQAQLCI